MPQDSYSDFAPPVVIDQISHWWISCDRKEEKKNGRFLLEISYSLNVKWEEAEDTGEEEL